MPIQAEDMSRQSRQALCPLCAKAGLRPLLACPAFIGVPTSGMFGTSPDSPVRRRDLAFDYCPACACVTQRIDAVRAIDYADVARSTARQLPDYARHLITRMRQEKPDGLVVEVGCNDGTFLSELRNAGYTRRLGIEPSASLAAAARAAGHDVTQAPLDADTAYEFVARHGLADIVVCRHTLEHVPQPLGFLATLHSLLAPEGLACIEVPSLAPLIERLHIEELWDEHLTYFLPHNLAAALTGSGCGVESLAIEVHRGMENLVVWARKTQAATLLLPEHQAAALCASFGQRWREASQRLRDAVAAAPRPRVAMGASHPQANFINFSGIADLVDATIDDDAAKMGRYLPLIGHSIPIHPTSALPQIIEGGTLLLTGFGYPQWSAAAQAAVRGGAKTVIDVSGLIAELSADSIVTPASGVIDDDAQRRRAHAR